MLVFLQSNFFDMTVWVAGSTHIVLLPKNEFWGESAMKIINSPTHRKWTFLHNWIFSEQLWRHKKKATTFVNTFNCRKTSKNNARYYSQDYYWIIQGSILGPIQYAVWLWSRWTQKSWWGSPPALLDVLWSPWWSFDLWKSSPNIPMFNWHW